MRVFTKNRVVTVGLTLAALALIYRNDMARDALTGNEKFLGIF